MNSMTHEKALCKYIHLLFAMSIQVHLHTNEQPRKKEREEKEEIMYIWKVYYCLFSHHDNVNTCLEK